jgi:hypothetical protein
MSDLKIVTDRGWPKASDGNDDNASQAFKNEREYVAHGGRAKTTIAAMDWAVRKIESDAKVIAALREALRRAAEALNAAVQGISNGPYTPSAGQCQLQDNLRAAVGDALLAANEQNVGK